MNWTDINWNEVKGRLVAKKIKAKLEPEPKR